MTFPRKTAIHHGLRVAAGVVWLFPFIDAPASARRRRNDASDTASLRAAIRRGSPRPSRETGL